MFLIEKNKTDVYFSQALQNNERSATRDRAGPFASAINKVANDNGYNPHGM